MPLRDHFHPPLRHQCAWESFHGQWTSKIVDRLNESVLPERYAARPLVHLGMEVQVDVATLEGPLASGPASGQANGVATAVEAWAPPRPALAGPVAFAQPDLFEVQVVHEPLGNKLVAAIELVSPSNKDRPATRKTFAVKCASYLAGGVSVVVVDVVTDRLANLHAELAALFDLPVDFAWQSPTGLAAVAYRVVRSGETVTLEVWPHALAVGSALPTLPLWLDADSAVPLGLEETYLAAWKSLRIR